MDIIYNNFNFCSTNFDDFFISIFSSNSINFDKIAIKLAHKYNDIKFDSI